MKNVSALLAAVLLVGVAPAVAQTGVSKASSVGIWKLDLQKSTFGSEAAPKSLTLTILKDTPQSISWRVDLIDDTGNPYSYSWSGPVDGSMQPITGADGGQIGKESAKRDGDALVRHGEDPKDGSSFDARATVSEDGNTLTDVMTMKSKDGKVSKDTAVMHRVPAARPGEK
jgi:hypothetical protein